jgi:NTE family protein
MTGTSERGNAGMALGAERKRMDPSTVDLVLEGGGAKGIGHLGVLHELEERGCRWQRIAGVSAGAIVGSLLASGHTGEALEAALLDLHVVTSDPWRLARIPYVGGAASVAVHGSLYKAERFRKWLEDRLRAPAGSGSAGGHLTFGDLRFDDDDRSDLSPYRLVVVVTDLTLGRLVYLPWDYQALYGVDPDHQRVADAVRASMAVPYAFPPVRILDGGDCAPLASGHGEAEFVDGGMVANYPIEIFDRQDGKEPRRPTIGVKILPRLPWHAGDLKLLMPDLRLPSLRYGQRVLVTTIFGRDQARLDLPWIKARTIDVDTGSLAILGFRPSRGEIDAVLAAGRAAAGTFVDSWDWDRYLTHYRSRGATPQ